MNEAGIWKDVYGDILGETPLKKSKSPWPKDREGVAATIDGLIQSRRRPPDENGLIAWERSVLLGIIDTLWPQYLNELEALEDDVQLHTYAEVDPLVAYRTEAARMFGQLMIDIERLALRTWLSGLWADKAGAVSGPKRALKHLFKRKKRRLNDTDARYACSIVATRFLDRQIKTVDGGKKRSRTIAVVSPATCRVDAAAGENKLFNPIPQKT